MEDATNPVGGFANDTRSRINQMLEGFWTRTGFFVNIPEEYIFVFSIGNTIMDVAAGPTEYWKSPRWSVSKVLSPEDRQSSARTTGKKGIIYIVNMTWHLDPENMAAGYRQVVYKDQLDRDWLKTLIEQAMLVSEQDMSQKDILHDPRIIRNRAWAYLEQKLKGIHLRVEEVALQTLTQDTTSP